MRMSGSNGASNQTPWSEFVAGGGRTVQGVHSKGGQMMVGHPGHPRLPTKASQIPGSMKNDQILSQITEFCRQADMAESTFGRRAVNDGKLVHRLREGKRITIDTLDRIQGYIASSGGVPAPRGLEVVVEKRDPRSNFRFFENRQKYLL